MDLVIADETVHFLRAKKESKASNGLISYLSFIFMVFSFG